MTTTLLHGDCRVILPTLPERSVHCCVTSPPYFGLRDYGHAGQMGLEATPAAYVEALVAVFRLVRRVLRDDGTVWLNLGDSYSSGGRTTQVAPTLRGNGKDEASGKQAYLNNFAVRPGNQAGFKPKDLLGIPWRVAFALQADGWYLRQDIIWHKPNPMPESVTDRCTKAHEYLFLLSKSPRYYFDAAAIAEPSNDPRGPGNLTSKYANDDPKMRIYGGVLNIGPRETRNKRSVWTVASEPFAEAHFATFPPVLIEPAILAGTSEKGCCAKCGAPWARQQTRVAPDGRSVTVPASQRHAVVDGEPLMGDNRIDIGTRAAFHAARGVATVSDAGWSPSCACDAPVVPCTVLDPFAGAGTTGLVADRLQRNAVLIELNPEYASMAEARIHRDAPLFVQMLT